MTGNKALKVVQALLIVFGLYFVVAQGFTLYKDYQEFKAMRVWVKGELLKQQQQRQREAQSRQQAPTPAQQPETARQ